jgi:ATP-dependent helicase/nuclease subunit A
VTDADDFLSSEAEALQPPPLPDTADTPAEHIDFSQKAYPHPLHIPSKLSISEIKRLFASDVTPDSTAFHTPPDTLDMPVFMQANASDARQMGTALHTIAEHMDVHVHTDTAQIQSLLATLTEKGLLKAEQAALIDPHTIQAFMRSPLADRMRAAKLYREIPFVMDMPDPGNAEISDESDEKVLVHGIIDCYFIEDGEIVLVDYKSDAVKGDADAWAARHRVQLDIYKKALEQATGLRVKQVLLYSFSLGRAVEVLI